MGQHPIQDWRALIRAWEKRDEQRAAGPGPLAGTVQGVLNKAQSKCGRQRKDSFFNYAYTPSIVDLKDIELTLDDEL